MTLWFLIFYILNKILPHKFNERLVIFYWNCYCGLTSFSGFLGSNGLYSGLFNASVTDSFFLFTFLYLFSFRCFLILITMFAFCFFSLTYRFLVLHFGVILFLTLVLACTTFFSFTTCTSSSNSLLESLLELQLVSLLELRSVLASPSDSLLSNCSFLNTLLLLVGGGGDSISSDRLTSSSLEELSVTYTTFFHFFLQYQ